MQNRYAGDIGDFGKFALLRALGSKHRLGIIWYLTSGQGETTNDGRHLAYISKPERFKGLDHELFETMNLIVNEFERNPEARSVRRLEQCELLNSASYFSDEVPVDRRHRKDWFQRLLKSGIGDSDVLFLDPDNGIECSQLTHKHVALDELTQLRRLGKPLVVYHHQGRVRGGAPVEATMLSQKMRSLGCSRVEIIRIRAYSSRFYVVVDHDDSISAALSTFVGRWRGLAELYKP